MKCFIKSIAKHKIKISFKVHTIRIDLDPVFISNVQVSNHYRVHDGFTSEV